MKKRYMLQTSIIAIALILTTILVFRPTPAMAQNANPHGMEMRSEAEGTGMKTKAQNVEMKVKDHVTKLRIENFVFTPETITVPVNSVVTWVNKDDIPHVIASNDRLFKSKALDTDQEFSYTFTKPGTYPYYCSVHPKMTGKIVVR